MAKNILPIDIDCQNSVLLYGKEYSTFKYRSSEIRFFFMAKNIPPRNIDL